MKKNTNLLVAIGVAVAYLAVVTVNALANILPINGLNTGELSDGIPNLFVPAGLTFSIWGVIYLLLAIFTVFFFVNYGSDKVNYADLSLKVGIPFIISSVANIAWILAWHYQKVNLSLLLMLVILGSLLYIYIANTISYVGLTDKTKNFVFIPISVYLGWITIATVANVTAVFVVNGWNRFGLSEEFWTIAVIIVATGITLGVIFTRKDWPYTLVVIWAFVGIIIKRLSDTAVDGTNIIITIAIALAAILISLVVKFVQTKKN